MKYILTLSTIYTLIFAVHAHAQDSSYMRRDTAIRHLNEVNVTSKYYQKYKLDNSSNSLKVLTPLLELPQNIQEIDKSILIDQQAINVLESVTRNVSGAMRNNTADFYSPLIYMRGAAINTLRNGVDLSMIYYGPMPEDAAVIDRMEFIKGPAGFVNAIGDPAGSFNILTKQPTGVGSHHISLTGGSFDLYRVNADFNGNIDKKKKWQYRLNVVGQKARSFQRFAFNDKLVVDPVLKYNINDHSSITAEYIYQDQRYMQYLITVFTPTGFASLPIDFSISDPNKKPVKANENNAFLTYQHRFNDKWQLTSKATFARDRLDGNYFFISRYDTTRPDEILRRVTYERFNTSVLAFQVFVNGAFTTGNVTHRMLAGVDANHKNLLAYSGSGDPSANQAVYPLNVKNPIYGIVFDPNVKQGRLRDIATNEQAITYYAGYVQDELAFFRNALRVTVAARLTSSKVSIDIPTISSVSDVVLTPRLGISYTILKELAAYALYDQTYTPQSGISTNGGTFEPLKGRNLEAGLKKDWFDEKWNTTLSVYHITRDNIIVTDPATNLQSQIGQTKSKGVELDLKGEVVKGLNAVINYAYTDAYVSDDFNKAYIGKPSPFRIRHIQNTWLNYRLPFKVLTGFNISAGYQLQAGRAGRYYQDKELHLADVFRVDGGLGWSNGKLSVNGIVNNIFNRFNYGSAWNRPAGVYAYVPYAPRELRVTLGYSFR